MLDWRKLIEHKTIKSVNDPVVVAECIGDAGYGDVVYVRYKGIKRLGRIIAMDGSNYFIEVMQGASGLNRRATIMNTFSPQKIYVSDLLLGRIFDGNGKSKDGRPDIYSTKKRDINGRILNPYFRAVPSTMIETGIVSIDLLNTLVMGQKLALFSSPGMPVLELMMQIMRQSIVNTGKNFVVVFAGIGLSNDEEHYILDRLEEFKVQSNAVLFLNSAGDPPGESLLATRMALTAAEYFAYEKGYNVLALLGDMTNYSNVLRNLASAKEELTVRQGYPSYLFSDLASMYERCGIQKGKKGSITQLPFLTMPNDDLTHPVPDTSGYISEGQLILSRDIYNKGISPSIDILNSLSRMMHFAVSNRHRSIADKIYNIYAQGKQFKEVASMMGLDVLDKESKRYVELKDSIDSNLLKQESDDNIRLRRAMKTASRIIASI